MQESGAKRPAKLLQRIMYYARVGIAVAENDRVDTLQDACQVGNNDGDV